jgi:hypothetical protein
MKKMNFYSNSNRLGMLCMMMIAMFVSRVSAQCPAVNFSYPAAACGTSVPVATAIPGAEAVLRAGVWVTTILPTDVGSTLQYRTPAAGTNCWNYVTIEDKSAPVVTAPGNITLTCATTSFPASVTGTVPSNKTAGSTPTSYNATGSALAAAITAGIVTDCSAISLVSYSDVISGVACGGVQTITRSWVAKDIYGNISAPAVQVITVVKPVVTLPAFFAGETFSCVTGINAVNAPSVAGCGLSFRLKDSLRVNLCGNTYKSIRTWQVVDQCGAGTMATDITQVVTVIDPTTPALTVSGTSYGLVNGPTYTVCSTSNSGATGTITSRKVQASLVSATAGAAGTLSAPIATSAGTIAVTAWGDASMCGAGTFVLNAASTDNCTNGSITTSDSRFTVSTSGVITGTVMGATTFDVISTDACGNKTTITVTVNVVDNIAPTAICDGVTATLNNYKSAVISGASFNHSSNDNCGIVRILVAKNVNGAVPTSWCDNVTYGCSDVGSTTLKVWIRYVDATGNYTDCCVPVTIVDKATISCVSTTGPSINCNDARLINVNSLFTQPTTFYDGCATPRIDSTTTNSAIACGSGTFVRSWTYTISNSATTAQSVTCSQTVTVLPIRGFRVTPLANQNLTCSGSVTTAEQDRQSLIANLKLLHEGSGFVTSVGSPGFVTCSAPVVDVTESTYSNTEFCKVIVRTFQIKDLCDFCPITSSTTTTDSYVPVDNGDLQSYVPGGCTGHFIRYTRYIYIRDVTAPTSTPPTIAPICVNDACTFGFSTTLTGSDGCGSALSGSSLFYSWRIVNAAGAVLPGLTNSGATVSASGLAFGTYTVFYRVSDLCGNISTELSFTFSGKDCKAPEILVHNKIVELAGQVGVSASGMATLTYADIRNRITDNCFGDLTNDSKVTMERGGVTTATAPGVAIGTKTVMFTCADANTVVSVRVWANDNPANTAAGNWSYVVTPITVQDNIGICRPTAAAAGLVGTENGSPVKDVVISANAGGIVAASATTPSAGTFRIETLTPGTSYQVRAAKTIDTDKKNGVTTLDIALISKHLLAETELNSAYKIIAADVDKNGEVDATDMLHIRRFILSITSNLPAGSAWRFIDRAYAFRNAANPLGEDFPEVVSLSNIPTGTSAANFMAVKLGDVNNSFDATQVRGSRALAFNAADMNVVAGNEYTVAINADNFNAAAFQGTFAFEGATVKAVKAGNLNNVSDNNFGMFSNAVSASWNGKSETSANVLNITFVATKSGKLSEMLTVNSAITMAEGYDAAGNAMNVTLKFNTGKVAGGEFALYQNTPNPVALSTKIGFNLPKDGQAKLTIYTAEGKVLSVINNGYKAGYNEVSVNKADLNASGMLYYRLDTQDNSSTRKMIIIE